jgi:hypothetical protein
MRLIFACVLAAACLLSPVDAVAQQMVKFKGTWTGLTVSADPTNFPVVAVVAEGEGEFTHLGRSEMVSPHTSHVFTGETLGDQIFTAANGDTLTAYCEGFPQPQPDGSVVGPLDCTITDGTGRFAGATGFYEFFLVARPRTDGGIGFATVAEIDGWISTVGASKQQQR